MWSEVLHPLFLLCIGLGINFSKAEEGEDLRATIKSLHVTSDIKFRYATTRVSAHYINTYNSPVTANFHVTLPAKAYISNFSMDIDGNVTYGVVKTKEVAKAIYEEEVAAGRNTGYVGVKHRFTNVYDVSVNVEPGKNVVFNLTYQELLKRSLGKYRHVIHLINKEIIDDFVIEVFITEPQDIIDVQIPKISSDQLDSSKDQSEEEDTTVEYIDNKNIYIRYDPSPEEQQKFGDDGIEGLFKVYYDVDREDNPNMVYAVDGYFVHFFAPDSLPPLPKNIVFMLDVSGSMQNSKINQLKQAMTGILKSLNPEIDNFLIGTFSSHINWMNDGVFMPAERRNTAYAIKEVSKLNANGGTNINEALLQSIAKLNSINSEESLRKSVLFFLTDGQASSGVTNSERIRNNTKEANNERVSFFMLAFGDNAAKQFLQDVAEDNGGFSRKIYVAADSQLQIEGLYNEISNILLKDIKITYLNQEIESESLSPTNFSSYTRGSEFCMTGILSDDLQEHLNVIMTMTDRDGENTTQFKLDFVNVTSTTINNRPNLTNLNSLSEITRNTWVYLTLKNLFKEERTENNTAEIISLALRYGFVTPLTSMVVTESKLVGQVQDEDTIDTGYDRGRPMHGGYVMSNKKFRGHVSNKKFRGHGHPSSMLRHTAIPIGRMDVHAVLPKATMMPVRTFTTTTRHMPITTSHSITGPSQPTHVNFIPGILLKTFACDKTLCITEHPSCLTHTKVLLLSDSIANIYIFGYRLPTNGSSCMGDLVKLVIKKKRKVFAAITPDEIRKNQKVIPLLNRKEVSLTIKKYLKVTAYIKTSGNQKTLSVHFTVLQPLPNPKGMLKKYMTDDTCHQLTRKSRGMVTYNHPPSPDQEQCILLDP